MRLNIFLGRPGPLPSNFYRWKLPSVIWYKVHTEFGTFHCDGNSLTLLTHRSLLNPNRTDEYDRFISTTFYPKKYHGFGKGNGVVVSGLFEVDSDVRPFTDWNTAKTELLKSLEDIKESTLIKDLITEKDERLGLFLPLKDLEKRGFEYIIEYQETSGEVFYFHRRYSWWESAYKLRLNKTRDRSCV